MPPHRPDAVQTGSLVSLRTSVRPAAAGGRIRPGIGGWQPTLLQDRFCQLLIDVGLNQLPKCKVEFSELDPTATRTSFRQVSDLDEITESVSIGAEGEAHEIEETLGRCTMHAGERDQPRRYFRILNSVPVGVGGPHHKPARILFAKQQHHIGGEIIRGVFGPPEQRNVEKIEHRVPHFVAHDIEELSEHRVGWAYAGGGVLRHTRQNIGEIFVADRHCRPLVPCIDHAALEGPHRQVIRQPERAENLLHFLERATFLERIVEPLVLRAFGWHVFDANPVRSRLVGTGWDSR
jgi:hypothetical protein